MYNLNPASASIQKQKKPARRIRARRHWLACLATGIVCVALSVLNGCTFGPKNNAQHILSDQGTIRCEIVVAKEAGPVAAFAARELQAFLSQSLGGNVPILDAPGGTNLALILGQNTIHKDIALDLRKLPPDGFVIKSVGRNIVIAGMDDKTIQPEKEMGILKDVFDKGGLQYERGTLFGVYEFLERFLNVRFYFPGPIGTVVPRHPTLRLPSLDIACHPDFIVRKIGSSGIIPDGGEEYDKASIRFKHLNNLRLRTQTSIIPNTHGLAHLDYIRRFGQSHPEYFALMNKGERYNNPAQPRPGQLCFSSGIREEIYKDAEALLRGQPAESRDIKTPGGTFGWSSRSQPGYFNVMPQDGLYPCHCAACQRHFKGLSYTAIDTKATSEFIWGLVCDVAERLQSNAVPGFVTAMAYSAYRAVPERKIPDNVKVMVALGGPWHTALPKAFAKEQELAAAWHTKLGQKVWFWNYSGKFGTLTMPEIPCITPHYIASYYQAMAPHIIGAFNGTSTDRFIFQYLNNYVFSKICWNTSLDVNALLKEHYLALFGPAAAPMETCYDRMEENWVKKIVGNPIETALGPSTTPPSDFEIWEKIYSKNELATLAGLFDQAEKSCQASPDHLERVRFIRKHMFQPMAEARARYEQNKQEIADLRFYVAPLPAGAKVTIDGVLDDAAWAGSEQVFLRAFPEPKDAAAAPPRTIVRALRDSNTLYVAFECEEPAMERIRSAARARDDKDLFRDSSVEVFLNPSGDTKRYIQILLNADGSCADLAGEKTGATQNLDWTWSSDATVAAKKGAGAWTAELAIPLARLEGLKPDGFPANFTRNRALRDAPLTYFTWSPFLQQGFHEIEKFGHLTFTSQKEINHIQNGDFTAEVKGSAFGGWSAKVAPAVTGAWAIVSNQFIKGGNALMLTGQGTNGVNVKQTLSGLKPDTDYLLTFYIRADSLVPGRNPGGGGRTGGASIVIWVGDKAQRFLPVNPYVGTIPWTKQGFAFKTGPAMQNGFIMLTVRNAKGTVWFDDVRLRECTANP